MNHPLKEIITNRKEGIKTGIVSVCSANRYVIQASMLRAKKEDTYLLVEATANQVNQFGGYTGMKPKDFKDFVYNIANENGFEKNRIILGGDHLGPLVWQDLPEDEAMNNSVELIEAFVSAGFTKIHLDTSMRLKSDDVNESLKISTIAKRGALLCKHAEKASSGLPKPVYIIGSEVPVPGGSQENEETVNVTSTQSFVNTYETYEKIFNNNKMSQAFSRVIGVVVQPGVEFADAAIHQYNRKKAQNLTKKLKSYPDIVFEGHSTDYQLPEFLKQMNEDGIGILKVGPALTFAMREGLLALEHIEKELILKENQSEFSNILEKSMLENPKNWNKHYHGSKHELKIKRKYSYSDRCRYYLPSKKVNDALEKLLNNLNSVSIPLTLLSQYMPVQYLKVRRGEINCTPKELLLDKIDNMLDDYYFAINPIKYNGISNGG